MNIAIVIIFCLLAGIIFINWQKPVKMQLRKEFLKKMENLLEGKCVPIDGQDNNYRIKFTYEGEDFIYEDIQEKGIKENFNKAYLKAITQSNFTLKFSGKEKKGAVRTEVFIASKAFDKNIEQASVMKLPKELEDFNMFSNDPQKVNKLLEDEKVVQIFFEFINEDARGYKTVSLSIVDGIIILEFHSAATLKPSIFSLRSNLSSLEGYLDKQLFLLEKIKEWEKE